ncbi:hypothetical protein YYC_05799 [Plasmodium yoelii 17X]|uniref:Plasmodium variant antigen protein Cir/Yir/Bir n=2 Tax=Plasmodium yoelii TaxID=5861 RepID=V7PBJ9_PLAYE|nr:hypothetical protein YYC_05799 [Plasmodium yoelii 17X]
MYLKLFNIAHLDINKTIYNLFREIICKAFKDIEHYLSDNFSLENNNISTEIYDDYCPIRNETGEIRCKPIGQTVSAVTVLLFNYLFIGNEDLEYENKNNEYIMYIMLWLSNKM